MSLNTILATTPLTSTGYHLKATGTTIGNSLIWDNGTNVGIGTASPDTLLHLSSTTDTSILRLERNSVTITSGQSYGQVQWEGQDASTGAAGVRSSIDVLSNGNLGETNLVFRTSGSNFNANLDRLTIDSSGNLGLGVTPSAWNGITALQIGGYASFGGDSSFVTYVSSNTYYNAGWKYIGVSAAANYYQDAGTHYFRSTSTTGTAGGAITWITPLTIASTGAATFTGNITVDKSSPNISINSPTGTSGQYNINNGVGSLMWAMYSTTGGGNSQGNFGLYSAGKTGGAGAVIDITPAGAATFSSSVSVNNAEILAKLDVVSSLAKTNTTFTRIASFRSNEASGSYPLELYIAQIGNATSSSQAISLQTGHYGLDFAANLAINADGGNVGIGTKTPLAPLQVNGNFRLYTSNGDGNELRGIFNVGGAADPLSFSMYKADATTIGTFITSDGASYFNGGNVLIGTTTDNNSKLLLTQSGTVNCLRINSTSASFNNYGIYFDAARNTTNDTFRAFAYYNSGAGAFKFYVLDSGNIYSTSTSITIISSDQKLKTDIRDYNKGLSEVLAMKPRIYKRKDNLEVDEIGFIAQEMGAALEGSMIESDKDENGEAIMTYKVEWYPLLVKAIQEMNTKIDEQNQTIQNLQEQINILAK